MTPLLCPECGARLDYLVNIEFRQHADCSITENCAKCGYVLSSSEDEPDE